LSFPGNIVYSVTILIHAVNYNSLYSSILEDGQPQDAIQGYAMLQG